jgi:hypothetical protein
VGYYMRYILTDDRSITLEELDVALKAVDSAYAIKEGELCHGPELYGEIELNHSGEELFEEEIKELQEFVNDDDSDNRDRVLRVLRAAKAILAIRVLWQGRETEPTLEKIDPLWTWLMANRDGLLQADGDGYYDRTGLVLQTE